MSPKKVLVFPCGSEIGLEIHRSLYGSMHFLLVGASSVDDHGRFVYENYIGDLPFINDEELISALREVILREGIHIVYPAMDSVIEKLKSAEAELGCMVISSPVQTTQICLSKKTTYETLTGVIPTPQVYSFEEVKEFPVFVKPDIGYGSRGAKLLHSKEALSIHLTEYPNSIITNYLPGEEYTVDCFTNRHGRLLYCGVRHRERIMNGISVHTKPVDQVEEFIPIVERINETIEFQGAWFVQLKRDSKGELVLLEIASRLGGSSALFRNKGINFAQLSLFDALGLDVDILENTYVLEMDRALDNKFKIDIPYDEVFIDFDDCIILGKRYFNTEIMKFIFQCLNQKTKITILSRHQGNLEERLKELGIRELFSRIIRIGENDRKSSFIDNKNAIFIDDSFAERKDIHQNCKIPVFGLDMIGSLLK